MRRSGSKPSAFGVLKLLIIYNDRNSAHSATAGSLSGEEATVLLDEASLGGLTAGSKRAGGMTSLHAHPLAHNGYVLGGYVNQCISMESLSSNKPKCDCP